MAFEKYNFRTVVAMQLVKQVLVASEFHGSNSPLSSLIPRYPRYQLYSNKANKAGTVSAKKQRFQYFITNIQIRKAMANTPHTSVFGVNMYLHQYMNVCVCECTYVHV